MEGGEIFFQEGIPTSFLDRNLQKLFFVDRIYNLNFPYLSSYPF
jgi:hypothetical protein